ncbi:MAG: YicC family protein [Clostridia bacterium]|nr:YicC family protein [Clostridia bacterium]MBO6243617.1 YicC family protein [Clostridia bacterium]
MIKSMTGYGKSSITIDTREYQVEIKTINHRFADISVKMPRVLSYLEEDIKKEILKQINRGKIEVFITYSNSSSENNEVKINTQIAQLYINELRNLAQQEGLQSNIEVTEIAKFPDVLKIKSNNDDEKVKQELLEVVNNATSNLVAMRLTEGEKIYNDLINRLNIIENKTLEISKLSTGLIDDYVVKLENRIKELLKTDEIDKARLAQEVVIYADKCSVEEEITRLKSHISQFRNMIKQDGAIGKKIDFLIQEMNRETNTIGSKANNLEITNNVIEIKTTLEDIREQIQNIE